MADARHHPDLPRLERCILARQGRREGREIRFLCPAHDDQRPSARWNPDKSTWYCDACHQGGGWRDLAERLGLPAPEPAREIAALYPYRDAAGRLLYEVLRFVPKAFACRRPDPAGWRWNLQGVERILYRLPELHAAVARGAEIFLTEGEKDADALAALGLEATTHAGGAGKWRPEYGHPLRAARVVLLPDNDEPGRRHMAEVEQSLRPLAAIVCCLDLPGLPEKGDVSDWIAARRAERLADEAIRTQLLALAQAALAAATQHPRHAPEDTLPASPTQPSAGSSTRPATAGVRRLSDVVARPVHYLWEPYLPLGKLTLMDGDPGQGKSWLTAALAAAGSRGWGLPGAPPFEPFTTLFFTEDPAEDVLRPRLDLLGADCSRILTCDTFELPLDLAQPADVARTEQLVADHRARLVVVDPIQAFLGAKTDIYRPNEVRAVLAPLLRLAQRHACALLVLRHITKARASRSIYAGQGSIDFIAAARSVLLAGSGPEDPTRHALVHIKSNLAPPGPTLGYRFDGRCFAWEGTSTLSANDLLAADTQTDDQGAEQEARTFLRDILAGAESLPARAILAAAREAGVSERTLKRAKRREGIRTIRQGFAAGSIWLWALPATPTGPPAAEGGHPKTWPPTGELGPLRPNPLPEEPLSAPPPDEKVTI
jgi:putative DNA primase/helicase